MVFGSIFYGALKIDTTWKSHNGEWEPNEVFLMDLRASKYIFMMDSFPLDHVALKYRVNSIFISFGLFLSFPFKRLWGFKGILKAF